MGALPPPVAIGGIGGSGTRLGAAMLQRLGYRIGGDLNDALDNLWFTLLFKRRPVLLDNPSEFAELVDLFWSRMSGEPSFTDAQRSLLASLCQEDRLQHNAAWLSLRAASFLDAPGKDAGTPWGWKEPNTHIVAERLIERRDELRYIHFVRHPLDIVHGGNQNQLQNWGPVLLDRDVRVGPRDALAYWCAVHRRTQRILDRWPERTLLVDFDTLCDRPDGQMRSIADFLGTELTDPTRADFRRLIDHSRPSRGRLKAFNASDYAWGDIVYLRGLNYTLE